MHDPEGLKITPEKPVPEAVESKLLDQAAVLISKALAMAQGERAAEPPAAATGKGSDKKQAAGDKKGAADTKAPQSPAAASSGVCIKA